MPKNLDCQGVGRVGVLDSDSGKVQASPDYETGKRTGKRTAKCIGGTQLFEIDGFCLDTAAAISTVGG